jgi:hypothetical protein
MIKIFGKTFHENKLLNIFISKKEEILIYLNEEENWHPYTSCDIIIENYNKKKIH